MMEERKLFFGQIFLMWLFSVAPDSEWLPWYMQLCCLQISMGLGSNLGSWMLLEVCVFFFKDRWVPMAPSLLNQMWMLESMNITHSVISQRIRVTEKHLFIDCLWTLLACVGLMNQYRNSHNYICVSSLSIPFSFYSSFYPIVSFSTYFLFFFFPVLPVVLSLNLLLVSLFNEIIYVFSSLSLI